MMKMQLVIATLLFIAAFGLVLETGVEKKYTIHFGTRKPPVEAGCHQIGLNSTDEGKVLNVYKCPT